MDPFGRQQLQVYQPAAGQPPAGQLRSMASQQQMQMQPFGRSPFDIMDEMMGPMGGPGMGMGNVLGGMFAQMDMMMRDMDNMGGMMPMGAGGSQVMMMSSAGGGGTFSSQTMVMSSKMGPDGQVHTERYSSSAVGDHGRQIHEMQQAYSNSTTGVDKMSLERQMADQGRKMVKERNRLSGEERSTNFFRGLEEDQAGDFDERWRGQAAPYLPSHSLPTQQMISGGGESAGAGRLRAEGQPHAAITYSPSSTVPERPYTAGVQAATQPAPRAQASAALTYPTSAVSTRAQAQSSAQSTNPFTLAGSAQERASATLAGYPQYTQVRPAAASRPLASEAPRSYTLQPRVAASSAAAVPPQSYTVRR